MSDPNELLVVAYPGENRASEVLQALQQLNHEHAVALHNAAVIVRHANGKSSIHETRDFDTKQGAVTGALAGGLLGLLKGDLVEGAVLGAGAGFVASKVLDLGFKDDYLQELATQLTPGSSAVVAIVEIEHADAAMQTLHQFQGGRILRTTLSPDVAQQVASALQ